MSMRDYFFPDKPKEDESEGAKLLRSTALMILVGHMVCAILALIVGEILTFVAQFIYVAMLYSLYAALHTWVMYAYMVLVAFNAVTGVFTLIGMLTSGLISFILYGFIMGFYLIAVRKLYYDSRPFCGGGDVAGQLLSSAGKNISAGIKN